MHVGGVRSGDARPDPALHNKMILQRYAMLQEKIGDIAADLMTFEEDFREDQIVSTIISEIISSLNTAVTSTREWTPPENEE